MSEEFHQKPPETLGRPCSCGVQGPPHGPRDSVCVGLPLGLLLVGLPELIHPALIHRVQPARTRAPRLGHLGKGWTPS